MRKQLCLILALIVCIGKSAFADDIANVQNPSTELEAFLQMKGQVIVYEWHRIGALSGTEEYNLPISALILSDPGSASKPKKGVGIYINGNIFLIDIQEIDSLIKGLDYMCKLAEEWKKSVPEEGSKVFISTKSDFQVGMNVLWSAKEPMGFVKSKRDPTKPYIPLRIEYLANFKATLEEGIRYLNNH